MLLKNSTAETSDGDDVSKVNAATPTTDDAEYDTIGTPRLTHNVGIFTVTSRLALDVRHAVHLSDEEGIK